MLAPRKPTKYPLLVDRLNTLLGALGLPTILKVPTDLTPPLLIAILEAILCMHFPIDFSASPEGTALQQTKIFLGVLETEVLEMDVGLSNMDPRKLASGEQEEILFIGELLCWVGRRHGIVVDDHSTTQSSPSTRAQPLVDSPSMSTSTKRTHSTTSYSPHRNTESITSLDSLETIAPRQKPISTSPLSRPRCIHEIPSPSLILSPDLDSSFAGPSSYHLNDASEPSEQNVRYTGYISVVDQDSELLTFESNRSVSSKAGSEDDEVCYFSLRNVPETHLVDPATNLRLSFGRT